MGTSGADTIYGRGGEDRSTDSSNGLEGGDGDDVIRGGDGQDHLFGDRGTERVFGGRGPDLISGETHNYNRSYCGTGIDDVFADRATKTGPNDTGVRDYVDDSCERVDR